MLSSKQAAELLGHVEGDGAVFELELTKEHIRVAVRARASDGRDLRAERIFTGLQWDQYWLTSADRGAVLWDLIGQINQALRGNGDAGSRS